MDKLEAKKKVAEKLWETHKHWEGYEKRLLRELIQYLKQGKDQLK
jgi:hypothetical protein